MAFSSIHFGSIKEAFGLEMEKPLAKQPILLARDMPNVHSIVITKKKFVIGAKMDCDFVLEGQNIRDKHVLMRYKLGQWTICPLHKKCEDVNIDSTLVPGESPFSLHHGVLITLDASAGGLHQYYFIEDFNVYLHGLLKTNHELSKQLGTLETKDKVQQPSRNPCRVHTEVGVPTKEAEYWREKFLARHSGMRTDDGPVDFNRKTEISSRPKGHTFTVVAHVHHNPFNDSMIEEIN